jgi:hypothetical protein
MDGEDVEYKEYIMLEKLREKSPGELIRKEEVPEHQNQNTTLYKGHDGSMASSCDPLRDEVFILTDAISEQFPHFPRETQFQNMSQDLNLTDQSYMPSKDLYLQQLQFC